uniref:non-specific serine/threonine protein kinase n=3 Tax=Hordeum vulgare subsp. vulgare TaxID=112509 RepID=A0A8I6WBT1_HORVV
MTPASRAAETRRPPRRTGNRPTDARGRDRPDRARPSRPGAHAVADKRRIRLLQHLAPRLARHTALPPGPLPPSTPPFAFAPSAFLRPTSCRSGAVSVLSALPSLGLSPLSLAVRVVVLVATAVVDAMGERGASWGVIRAAPAVALAVAVLGLAASASSTEELISSRAEELEALMAIRAALQDPDEILGDWIVTAGRHRCRWTGVTCSVGRIDTLQLQNMHLAGTLPPAIGKLRRLRNLLLDHNAISGPIPDAIGGLPLLRNLSLSNNQLNGTIPDSLINSRSLFIMDLSFNNLSGTVQAFNIKNVLLTGNPLLHYPGCGGSCASTVWQKGITLSALDPPTYSQSFPASIKTVVMCLSIGFAVAVVLTTLIAATHQWRRRRLRIFADMDGNHMISNDKKNSEVCHGHLKMYTLKDIKQGTIDFHQNNILGHGGFGVVYKGILHGGTIAAVKRLKDFASSGEVQFHTEVEVMSLVVHRNLINLIGFCSEDNERILVYPYMLNGTVASQLQAYVSGRPALDWPTRKKIALGTARGLAYLHERCVPKIIHRDIKASNILLDEHFQAIVSDFGLAKLLGEGQSHVFTAIRGTFGRIAPEYLMTGESSEKTDVFAYGLLLMELITGRNKLDVNPDEFENGGVVDWARELLEDGQLSSFVDTRLKSDYNEAEAEEMVQIALLCTMYRAAHRPRMSEVVRMLEGDGSVAGRWESLKNVQVPQDGTGTPNFVLSPAHYSEDECNSVELEAVELSGPR